MSTYMCNVDYNQNIIILQCTSSYPCPDDEIDLNVMNLYKSKFPDAVIGYSGHEKGIAISLAAVAIVLYETSFSISLIAFN